MVTLPLEREGLARSINRLREQRIQEAVNRLLERPAIRDAVGKQAAMIHVLRLNIAKGIIPEQNGQAQAQKILEQARLGGAISDKLLSNRPPSKQGRPPISASHLQDTLAKYAEHHEDAKRLLSDATFAKYLKNMAIVLHTKGHSHKELTENPLLANAILNHVTSEYQLMRELTVPPSIIKTQAHKFTVYHADQTYRDVKREFGDDEETKPLTRTAAFMLLQKLFPNAKAIKTAYQTHLESAKEVFGDDEETKPLTRTAAVMLLQNKFPNAKAAKSAFDEKLKQERDRARKIQVKDLALPFLSGLERDAALERLGPIISQIGDNFSRSDLGKPDAMQTARLEALLLLGAGERDAEIIVNAMITKVTKEAATYAAFRNITIPLPEER